MKKYRLAMLCVGTLALAACSASSNTSEAQTAYQDYKGQVILSSIEGDNLKLTVAKIDCGAVECQDKAETFVYPYDSNIVVGATVKVDLDENNGKVIKITNISRSKSSSVLSRTGKY